MGGNGNKMEIKYASNLLAYLYAVLCYCRMVNCNIGALEMSWWRR